MISRLSGRIWPEETVNANGNNKKNFFFQEIVRKREKKKKKKKLDQKNSAPYLKTSWISEKTSASAGTHQVNLEAQKD